MRSCASPRPTCSGPSQWIAARTHAKRGISPRSKPRASATSFSIVTRPRCARRPPPTFSVPPRNISPRCARSWRSRRRNRAQAHSRRSHMKLIGPLLTLTVLLIATPATALDSIVGKWKTVDDKTGKVMSDVEIYQQGDKLFGKITGLAEPNYTQGKPKVCTKCAAPDKDKPIVGLVIIKDLSASGDRYKNGTITDPEDGKVYKAEVWTEAAKLKVRGYLGPFYKTQTWVKGD